MTSQKTFLTRLCADNPDAYIVGSLGTICYDLDKIDHKHKILIRGAMGAAVGCGLGIALNTDKRVLVFVGDGSFLMKLGSMATCARYKPGNLRVIVFDNGCYKSCGDQKTSFGELQKRVTIEIIPTE